MDGVDNVADDGEDDEEDDDYYGDDDVAFDHFVGREERGGVGEVAMPQRWTRGIGGSRVLVEMGKMF